MIPDQNVRGVSQEINGGIPELIARIIVEENYNAIPKEIAAKIFK